MAERPRGSIKEFLGSAAMTIVAVIAVLVGGVVFLLQLGVEFSFLGSIWLAVSGEWRAALIVLLVALAVSWFVLGA